MEGNASLPNIRDMYHSTRQNRDYNVIKNYQGRHKNFAMGTKPTKKDHYLDIEIKYKCSPGPAHKANSIATWAKKPLLQPKRGPKSTYLDDITKMQKKKNFPAANNYSLNMDWPQKNIKTKDQITNKTNFFDTCQYDADKTPGPGNYNIRTIISKGPEDKKWTPHPVNPREILAAHVGTYNPCAVQYTTFDRIKLKKNTSNPSLLKKSPEKPKDNKENQLPGPGTYATINFWQGKTPNKENERNYLKFIHKGSSANVYY